MQHVHTTMINILTQQNSQIFEEDVFVAYVSNQIIFCYETPKQQISLVLICEGILHNYDGFCIYS